MKPRQKPRILFFAEDVALSHVVRPLVLAEAINDDYDVVLATGATHASLIEQKNIAYRHIWTLPSETFLSRLQASKDPYTADDLSRQADEDLKLIRDLSPDLVVGDLRLSLGISSEVAGIPYVSLINGYWSPYCSLVPPPPEMPFVKVLGVSLSTLVMPVLMPLILKKLVQPFNAARDRYGLAPIPDYRAMFTCAPWVLYLDLPTLAPTENAPPQHSYIGPVLWEPDVPLPHWWNQLPADKPVAYVSMGSTGGLSSLRTILEALHQLDVTLMLATSGRIDARELPDYVFSADYLPGIAACERSTFVVCNGGTGAIHQAIRARKPILGIPSNADQYFAMGAIAKEGAGLYVRSGQVNGKRVRLAASSLMSDPSFADASQRLAAELSDYDAPQRFRSFLGELWQD